MSESIKPCLLISKLLGCARVNKNEVVFLNLLCFIYFRLFILSIVGVVCSKAVMEIHL